MVDQVLSGACAALVNAAHVFAAHWEGNLTIPANYLADTAYDQADRIARFKTDPDRETQRYFVYGQALVAAAERVEADWEGNLSEAAQNLAAVAADYEAAFGPVPFVDPLA